MNLDRFTIAGKRQAWLAEMPIGTKLRLASLCNVAAVVIMLLSIAFGGKIALDLRAQRMAVSEAIVAAAELTRSVETSRLASYRLADGNDGQETGIAADEVAIASGRISELERLVPEVSPGTVPRVVAMRQAFGDFSAKVASMSQDSGAGRQAEAVYASGERLAGLTSRLDTELYDLGAALDARASNRIILLFGFFFVITALSIGMILFSARILARDISTGLAGLTNAARTIADGDQQAIVPGLDRSDEIGELAKALETAREGAVRIQRMAE
ncbi:MAG TPA: HAMP domain-containing protein, partial [Qipengyuania sp.]|nr:HAMP domain-containing protein [Qipengyuania sp.]